eukprot:6492672-Amphidinium_carterae.6
MQTNQHECGLLQVFTAMALVNSSKRTLDSHISRLGLYCTASCLQGAAKAMRRAKDLVTRP